MFTGIVEEVARVVAVTPLTGGRRLRLACSFAAALAVDESVAVAGVCLTVVQKDGEAFEAVAVEETLSKTTLGHLAAGQGVNVDAPFASVADSMDTSCRATWTRPARSSTWIARRLAPHHGRLSG